MSRTSGISRASFQEGRPFPSLRTISLALLETALRGYVAFVWIRFGLTKIQSGWMTSNPLRPLLELVTAGQLPSTAGGFDIVARVLVALHADAVLSVVIPLAEVAVALAITAGVCVRVAALLASMLNVNLLLMGIASLAFDGRMTILELIVAALVTLTPVRPWRVLSPLVAG